MKLTQELLDAARRLRQEGKTLGEIAHAVKWPKFKSLRQLEQIVGPLPRRRQGGIECGGPPVRPWTGTWG